jgi:predicted nucleotidyltransferase
MDSRQIIIQAFTDACAGDERVVAAFLGGSLAAGSDDDRSDLDLYVLILSEKYTEFFAARRNFFERWGNPVFLEDFNDFGFDMLVFILSNGVEGELSMAKDEDFLHIHGGRYKVLVDKKELLENTEFPLQGPAQEDQVETLQKNFVWFWRDLSLFCTALARGQKWTAYGYLESMRLRCVILARLDRDFTTWADGYEKLEGAAEEYSLESLENSFSTLDRESMIQAANYLIDFYRSIVPKIAQENDLEYPESLEQVMLRREAKVLGVCYL